MRNITLQTLRDWDACSEGYDKIAKHVGENEVIDLDLALAATSIPDVVWVLSHDSDKQRWLSFLADMIDLSGCKTVAQVIRDCRDGRGTSEDHKHRKPRRLFMEVFHNLSVPSYAAARAVSISGEPRLIKLIRGYYQ